MKNFTQIPNELLRDESLSWQAKGLMCYLLSHKDTWKITLSHVIKTAVNGQRSVYSIISELIDKGYLIKTTKRESGRFSEIIYTPQFPPIKTEISFGSDADKLPFGGNPYMEKPYMEKPYMENSTPNNTNLDNTNLDNTNLDNNQVFTGKEKNGNISNTEKTPDIHEDELQEIENLDTDLFGSKVTDLEKKLEAIYGKELSLITYNVLYLGASGKYGEQKLREVRSKIHAEKVVSYAKKIYSIWPNKSRELATIKVISDELIWAAKLCKKLRQPEVANPVATQGDFDHICKILIEPLLTIIETRKTNFNLTPKVPELFWFFKGRAYFDKSDTWLLLQPNNSRFPKNNPVETTVKDNPF